MASPSHPHTLPLKHSLPAYILPTPSPPPEPENEITKRLTVQKKKSVQWLTIIQKYLTEIDGRDKLMKIIQYALKLLLHYAIVKARHWSALTAHFSMTRRLLRVGNAINPLKQLTSANRITLATSETLILFNALVNHISDDVVCMYKLGFIDSKIGTRAEMLSAYCWFASIYVDIKNAIQSRQKQRSDYALAIHKKEVLECPQLLHKIYVSEISILKLFMDGIFCACDIWHPSYSAGIQAWSGFCSGALAGYKLWIRYSD
ncbi:peroxisomal biogenesis factor 11-domain-containing protein [Pilobolus umbonatus]|nr:peroxisomal biogenesis factor 11-domain-containing protein [Pilobolus umbonatus]